MKITTKVFFKKITIRNKELIPKKGPIIIVANHPSSFMDPIVIATLLNRELFFLAKAEVFKSKFAKWLLPKLNMIPVYRKQDDPSLMMKNEETFFKCYEHLEKGGAILLFPEGTSITERKLRPIKTGAARIILGAEARNDFRLDAQIITVGLNYESPHEFKKDLFVNIEPPIKASDYKARYVADAFSCTESLTEKIRLNLEKLIISINDNKTDKLSKDIEMLYKSKLTKDLGLTKNDKSLEFILTKNMIESVEYFLINQPLRATEVQTRIEEYLNNIKRFGLSDSELSEEKRNSVVIESFKTLLFSFVGLPIYLFGLITNYLPFKLPGWIADVTVQMSSFRGAIQMVTGTLTFLLFYCVEVYFVWTISDTILTTIAFAIALPFSGLFGYWYYVKMAKLRAKWVLMMLFYKKTKIISSLIVEREKLISEFDEAKKEYLVYKENM